MSVALTSHITHISTFHKQILLRMVQFNQLLLCSTLQCHNLLQCMSDVGGYKMQFNCISQMNHCVCCSAAEWCVFRLRCTKPQCPYPAVTGQGHNAEPQQVERQGVWFLGIWVSVCPGPLEVHSLMVAANKDLHEGEFCGNSHCTRVSQLQAQHLLGMTAQI
jgi:hypothetical protein